ncbi:MAG: acyl-CoA desaturase [Phycisphaerales bacterium]
MHDNPILRPALGAASSVAAPPLTFTDDAHADVALGAADTHLAEVVRASRLARFGTLAAVIVPPLALVATMALAWGGWFGWVDLALMVGMYVITGLGVTIGYHRLVTHRAFRAKRPIELFFAICGSMAAQGPILWWAATHRRHHQHSDHEHDPHSPHAGQKPGFMGRVRGFLHAHIGWLLADLRADADRYIPDLTADRGLERISALFPLWVLLGLALPAAIGGLVTMSWMGVLLGFLWGGLVRMLLLHHVTWSVNSVCHLWGARDYRSGDESRNNPVMGVLALGEGWHNNHHAFPASARHGLKWWQFDLSWVVIRTLEKLGLAEKVRVPSADRLAARAR